MGRPPLPIDGSVERIRAALAARGALVLVAEPGAGKTTRVPPLLLDDDASGGEILVLEPRRLAARLSAGRVADELGERLGERVGYQVRFDERSGPRTRLRFLTEGILTRRLLTDPELRGVSAVVLDEFHERHLHGDLALAWLSRLRVRRPELRLVVMSATLDAEPVARFLDCEALSVTGRTFEVALEHAERASEAPLGQQVASALRRLITGGLDGDVLVFLPGAAEIRRAAEACDEVARGNDLEITLLHGELAPEAQERAIRPGARRKVILSTNVAETSITVEGVVAVIDSGLARVARHSPWSGLPQLAVEKVARASAVQRAGRAGRLRAGRCVRLYTRHDFEARPAHQPPEIRRLDLAETVLTLRAAGAAANDLAWLEPPPAPALEAAERLLDRLGATDGSGAITELGRRMAALPLHPRLGRVLLEAQARGAAARGALLVALLGEREIRQSARGGPRGAGRVDASGPSDLLERLEAFEAAATGGLHADRLRAHGLDVGAAMAASRSRDQLLRALGERRERPPTPDAASDEEALLVATLAGFPDRVGRRRAARSPDVVLAGGGSARLAETSVVRDAPLVACVEVEERKGTLDARRDGGAFGRKEGSLPMVRLASAVEAEWLLDLYPERFTEERAARFDPAAERVELSSGLAYDGLLLDETRRNDATGPEVSAALSAAALAASPRAFADAGALDRLAARTAFARTIDPELPLLDDAAARATLAALCEGRRSFAELRDADLPGQLLARLDASERARLERHAPDRVQLPGGRRVVIQYTVGQTPWIESRLQDFFGLGEGPRVGGGRVALVLHLLAPNGRAVQVTADLAGFWQRHYPSVRRELMRRYPRHAWPDDPLTASPPAPGRR